jgi:hypothetical protein
VLVPGWRDPADAHRRFTSRGPDGVLFLGKAEMLFTMFNERARSIFNIVPSDLGRCEPGSVPV